MVHVLIKVSEPELRSVYRHIGVLGEKKTGIGMVRQQAMSG